MIALPTIMAAPNGARRGKVDHAQLPVTHDEIVATAMACHRAGAGAVHLHVRDATGAHVLDAGRYRRLLRDLTRLAPDLIVQVTTEAVGQYQPAEQMALVRDLRPKAVSIALREIAPDEAGEAEATAFFAWCRQQDIAVQHILYDQADLARLARLLPGDDADLSVLFVLGRYRTGQESEPEDLTPFLSLASMLPHRLDWMVCAFGVGETACLSTALTQGGKVRVGFENSLWNGDGSLAVSNEARVAAISAIANALRAGDPAIRGSA